MTVFPDRSIGLLLWTGVLLLLFELDGGFGRHLFARRLRSLLLFTSTVHSIVDTCVVVYTRSELLGDREGALGSLSSFVRRSLHRMFVDGPRCWSHGRGCRAGARKTRPIPVLVVQRPSPSYTDKPLDPVPLSNRSLLHLKMERHLDARCRRFRAGMLDIRSVGKKVYNVVDLIAEYRLYLLVLTETWHEDEDRTAIKRLRGHGLNVIEAVGRMRRCEYCLHQLQQPWRAGGGGQAWIQLSQD